MNASQTAYSQQVLDIDLSSGVIKREEIEARDIERFLGGRGVAAAILARSMRDGIAPLDPGATFIFSMGTLTGTNAPMTGRSGVTFISPVTGLYCKANVGGHFGLYCKLNGIDYIVIRGAADHPTYLWIGDDGAELHDARFLWGRGIRETTAGLEERHGQEINVACIGPAGENRVAFAAVMSSIYNAAARGGGGAVLGSKNLKAIAVGRPHRTCAPVAPEAFGAAAADMREVLYADTMSDSYYTYGTAASVDTMNETDTLPSRNFQRGRIEKIDQLTSQYWNDHGLLKGRIGCASCIYSCHRFVRIDDGPYAGACSAGPEYETVSALGTGPEIESIGALQRANELCNDLGLDTISAGGVIQWAMETYEKGLLPAKLVGDMDLRFGSEQAVTELPAMIARREGLGDLLAEGTQGAAERIGGDSWKWAVQTRGLEQSRVETRGALGYALAFAMNPRGPDHLHTECIAEFGMTPEMRGLIAEITGDEAYARSDITEKRAEIVRYHEDVYAFSDALGVCAFASTAAYGANPKRCARLFSAFTGIPLNADKIVYAGRRIVTLERLINLRLGWVNDPRQYAPWRLMNEPLKTVYGEFPRLDMERMAGMVREYYDLHGWDDQSGIPGDDAIKTLDLEEFVMRGSTL